MEATNQNINFNKLLYSSFGCGTCHSILATRTVPFKKYARKQNVISFNKH